MEKAVFETLAGFVGVGWTGAGLVKVGLPAATPYDAESELQEDLRRLPCKQPGDHGQPGGSLGVKALEKEISAYFRGEKADLAFPVDWGYHTMFQQRVLQEVCKIPWGRVVSYGEIAAAVGNPRGPRAVGGAVGSNRVLLVVPCHRVIAHDGSLGGFGSGLDWKKRLLKIEGINF